MSKYGEQQRLWLIALYKSLDHWKQNYKALQEVSDDEWKAWISEPRPLHSTRDRLKGINITGSGCACCQFQKTKTCQTRCPLCPDPDSVRWLDEVCDECANEWYNVTAALYTQRKSKESALVAMQKMIARIKTAIREVRFCEGRDWE